MIKKIFVGVLLAGVFGLLVLGAVNRTIAKSNENEPLAISEGNGAGNGGETLGRNEGQGVQTGESREVGQGYGGGAGAGNGNNQIALEQSGDNEIKNGSGGNGGFGQGNQNNTALGDENGIGLADVEAWEDPITVTVDSISDDLWGVSNDAGFVLEIEGRALSYMLDNGFQVEIGDELVLTGFYEGDKFEIGGIQNISTGQTFTLREASGRPLWAGGRQGNRNP